MKIRAVLTYLTRNAGGMYESVRHLHQATAQLPGVQIDVCGLSDSHIGTDLPVWAPLPVKVFTPSGPRQFQYAPGLRRYLLEGDADILHTHGIWTYPSVAVSAWHRQFRKPYLISPHGMLDPWAVKNSGWKKKLALAFYEREHLANAACLRALCQSEADAMRQFGLRNPICIVPNGITPLSLEPGAGTPSPFEPFARGRRALLYLGRLHPKKGLPNLLHAWRAFRTEHPVMAESWMLAIAGWDQGDHESELKRYVAESGLESTVQFLGPQFREAKAACYRHSSAFILPSFSEGLPMVVLEAWSHAKPVVMTPQCNLPEGFAAGAAVRIGTDQASIQRGLCSLATLSDQERADMGQRGLALVRERFAWPQIAHQIHAVYAWLLGGGPQPDCVQKA